MIGISRQTRRPAEPVLQRLGRKEQPAQRADVAGHGQLKIDIGTEADQSLNQLCGAAAKSRGIEECPRKLHLTRPGLKHDLLYHRSSPEACCALQGGKAEEVPGQRLGACGAEQPEALHVVKGSGT